MSLAEGPPNERSDLLEKIRIDFVAEGVVGALEVVEADEEDKEGVAGALGEPENLLGVDVEATAVKELGAFIARECADGALHIVRAD